MSRPTDDWPLIAVYDGRRRLGFGYIRRHQFEAFNADVRSLGLFDAKRTARQAIVSSRRAA
jgi:hypothetical protein